MFSDISLSLLINYCQLLGCLKDQAAVSEYMSINFSNACWSCIMRVAALSCSVLQPHYSELISGRGFHAPDLVVADCSRLMIRCWLRTISAALTYIRHECSVRWRTGAPLCTEAYFSFFYFEMYHSVLLSFFASFWEIIRYCGGIKGCWCSCQLMYFYFGRYRDTKTCFHLRDTDKCGCVLIHLQL